MFKQGKTLVVTLEEYMEMARAMDRMGYLRHTLPRIRRAGEVDAWRMRLPGEQQNHVQVVANPAGLVELYAHTEPWGVGVQHLISAILDHADFVEGAALLRHDLRRFVRK
jgi:hypothetical protein